jgi:hypothetical protein
MSGMWVRPAGSLASTFAALRGWESSFRGSGPPGRGHGSCLCLFDTPTRCLASGGIGLYPHSLIGGGSASPPGRASPFAPRAVWDYNSPHWSPTSTDAALTQDLKFQVGTAGRQPRATTPTA